MKNGLGKVKNREKPPAITGHFFYEKYSVGLPKRAELVAKQLDLFNAVFLRLFSDENFVTLLRAESMSSIPGYLKILLGREKKS